MWEVVGFGQRTSKEKVYYDIFLQRENKKGQGIECRAGSYSYPIFTIPYLSYSVGRITYTKYNTP